MKLTAKSLLVAGSFFLALGLGCGVSQAQQFPAKPIRILDGYPPGTVIDIVGRKVAQEMLQRLGQPVVYENQPGANATIAGNAVVKSSPDGYVLFISAAVPIHPVVNKNNGIVVGKQLDPVADLFSSSNYMFVNARLNIKTLKDLFDYGRANPGKLNYASSTAIADLVVFQIAKQAGFTYTNIYYKGSPAIAAAIIAGESDFTMSALPAYQAFVNQGKVNILFVGAAQRVGLVPNVPTIQEAGGPNVPSFAIGLWAPAGTPRAVAQKLNTTVNSILELPDVTELIRKAGTVQVVSTPEQQLSNALASIKFYEQAAADSGYKPE